EGPPSKSHGLPRRTAGRETISNFAPQSSLAQRGQEIDSGRWPGGQGTPRRSRRGTAFGRATQAYAPDTGPAPRRPLPGSCGLVNPRGTVVSVGGLPAYRSAPFPLKATLVQRQPPPPVCRAFPLGQQVGLAAIAPERTLLARG